MLRLLFLFALVCGTFSHVAFAGSVKAPALASPKAQIPITSTGPQLIMIGDSIVADAPGSRRYLEDYVGDKVYFPQGYQQAIGGQSALAILNGLDSTIARINYGKTIVYVGPIGANLTTDSMTYAQVSGQMRQIFDKLIAAGAAVVVAPTLSDKMSTPAASRQRKIDLANYVRAQTDITVADTTAFDPEIMKTDNTHPNFIYGAPYLGLSSARAIASLVGAGSALPTTQTSDNLLGADWSFGGAVALKAPGVTGTGPTNWGLTRLVGTGNWVVSKEKSPDGFDTLVLSIANSPDRGMLQIANTVNFSGKVGDVYDFLVQAEYTAEPAPGSAKFLGTRIAFQGSAGAVNSSGGIYGVPSQISNIRTNGTPLSSATSTAPALIQVGVDVGGTLTVRFRRAKIALRENISALLAITGAPSQAGQVGVPYTANITATNGTTPYRYSISSGTLPAGLTIAPGAGIITGTPTAAGMSNGIVVRVTDSAGQYADLTPFNLQIVAAGVPINTVSPSLSGLPQVGQTLTINNGTWTNLPTSFTYQWLVNGNTNELSNVKTSTYVIAATYVGANISANVTATNSAGPSAQVPTGQTSNISPAAPTATIWDTSVNYNNQLVYGADGVSINAASTINGLRFARAAMGQTSGKYYYELFNGGSVVNREIGVGTDGVGGLNSGVKGVTNISWVGGGVFQSNGPGSASFSPIGLMPSGSTVQVAVDLDAKAIWFRANGAGNWNANPLANPGTGVSGFSIANLLTPATPIYPIVALPNNVAAGAIAHFSSSSWTYVPPTGFGVWTN